LNNTFEIIGKLSVGKESDKFKPHEKNVSPSGWAFNKLLFNVLSAENRHMLESKGMYKEDGTGIIYSFSKGTVDPKTHEKQKGEKLQIAWKDRAKPEVIDNVAEFKKFVVDLEKYGRRYELQKALDKQNEGNLTEEELTALGVTDLAQALEDSNKKRKVFLSDYDFTEYLYKLITSGKIDGKIFKVVGDIVFNEYQGNIYRKLVPTRVYLVDQNEPQTSIANLSVYFNKESLDSGSFAKTKKHYVNGFARNYDNARKDTISAPIQLTLDDSNEDEKVSKVVNIIKKQFEVKDNTWKELGVKIKMLDGAQKAEITPDMLTDFQKEMLELEAITMDDIRKEIGGDVYGEKVQEWIIVNVAKGYTKGRKDTVYVSSDFENKVIVPAEKPASKQPEDEEDLGLDDLDDIL
jgi:hypothetical protein